MRFEDHPELIADAARVNGVSEELILAILRLEPESRNLHGYGNRPAFRRRLLELVDKARAAGEGG